MLTKESLRRLHGAFRALEAACVVLAGFSLCAIMLVVVIDVVLRYLFNAPLTWSYGLISLYLTASAFFLAISDAAARNHHVAVDILYLRFPDRGKWVARLIGAVVGLPVFTAILCLAVGETSEKWIAGDVLAGHIPWPTWIASLIVVIGAGLMVVRFLFEVVACGTAIVTGRPLLDPVGSGEAISAE